MKDGSKASHEDNSKQGIGIAQRTWHSVEDSTRPESKSPFIGSEQVKDALKGARESQLQAGSHSSSSTPHPKSGSVTSRLEASEVDVQVWLTEIQRRRGEDGRLV